MAESFREREKGRMSRRKEFVGVGALMIINDIISVLKIIIMSSNRVKIGLNPLTVIKLTELLTEDQL